MFDKKIFEKNLFFCQKKILTKKARLQVDEVGPMFIVHRLHSEHVVREGPRQNYGARWWWWGNSDFSGSGRGGGGAAPEFGQLRLFGET
jgi:hypothetical protein